ncbi:unnamed protein product [Victoria cruziana]
MSTGDEGKRKGGERKERGREGRRRKERKRRKKKKEEEEEEGEEEEEEEGKKVARAVRPGAHVTETREDLRGKGQFSYQ